MATVYISVGNSDGRLSHQEWAGLVADVDKAVRVHADTIHGAWHAYPATPFVNACWCAVVHVEREPALRALLRHIAHAYRQESIAWAPVPVTEFLPPLVLLARDNR